MSSAVADNVAMLGSETNKMNTTMVKTPVREGSLMPTSKMSIEQLLEMETQAADFSVDPTSEIGTVIYQTSVNPISMTTNVTTRVEWLSRLFKFWRGVLILKFIFTKTILQQCKFLAVFVPGAKDTDDPPSTADAYYYTHKMVMNPVNETELTFEIPFVNDRPFLPITESTGMFYFMVYQPIVNSFQSDNPPNIYVKVFNSAKLELHETIPLINLGNESSNVLTPSLLWAVTLESIFPTGAATALTTTNLITDNGSSISTPTFNLASYAHPAYTAGKPTSISEINITQTYSPSICRTLSGNPSGNGTARYVYFARQTVLANTAMSVIRCQVVANATGIWLTTANSGTPTLERIIDEVASIAGTYTSLFSSLFSAESEMLNLETMLNTIGVTCDDLKEFVESRKFESAGHAHGNDCPLECDCGKCCPRKKDVTDACVVPTAPAVVDWSDFETRLKSFVAWPLNHISPVDLAKSGFYYYGLGDTVRCYCCKILINKWVYGDVVEDEHRKFSPDCGMFCPCRPTYVCLEHRLTKMSPCREFSAYLSLNRVVCQSLPRLHAERDHAVVCRKEGWVNPALGNTFLDPILKCALPRLDSLIMEMCHFLKIDISLFPDVEPNGPITYKVCINVRQDLSNDYQFKFCQLFPSVRDYDFVQKFTEFDFYERILLTVRHRFRLELHTQLCTKFDATNPRHLKIWKLLNY